MRSYGASDCQSCSSTIRSSRLRSRIAVTPEQILDVQDAETAHLDVMAEQRRGLAEDHARRTIVTLDHVVGHQPMPAHHELERAFALPDAALAQQEHADLEYVDQHAMDARARGRAARPIAYERP